MSDLRTLTFTIDQLADALLAARFAEPPTFRERAKLEIRRQLDAEFYRQQGQMLEISAHSP